jgi:fibronectin type 3 domain-containing protein
MRLRPRAASLILTLALWASPSMFAGPGAFGFSGFASCGSGGSNRVVHLSWSTASSAVTYSIYRGTALVASGKSGNAYDDTGASNSTYDYTVRAYNAAGVYTESNVAHISAVQPACQQPALAASGWCDSTGGPSAHLNWSAIAGANGYVIFRDTTPLTTVDGSVRTYDDFSATSGQHTYKVTAASNPPVDLIASGVAVPSCSAPPSAPASVSKSASCINGKPNVHLSWSTGNGATGYRLYRNSTLIAAPTTTTFDDVNVTAGQTYTYVVQSVNKSGTAESSGARISVDANVCLPPPGDFTVSALPGCNGNTPIVQLTWSPSSSASSYVVQRDNAALSGSLPSSQTTYTDTAVAAGQHHTYSVVASNESGTKSTTTVGADVTGCINPPPVPSLTAALFCSGTTAGARLTWTASTGATGYTVYRDGTLLAGPINVTTFDDIPSAPGSYAYFVRASNGSASSDSATRTVVIASDSCVPVTPPSAFSLFASAFCDTSAAPTPAVRLVWTASTQGVSYTVLRGSTTIATLAGTTYLDHPAAGAVTYKVRATNSAGSMETNAVDVTLASALCTNASPKPDLAAATLIVPAIKTPGSTFAVAFTIINLGDAAAPATTSRVRLGAAELQAGDPVLAELDTPALAPGASATLSAIIDLSPDLAPGTWWLFATADDFGTLTEITRANNTTRSDAIEVVPLNPFPPPRPRPIRH